MRQRERTIPLDRTSSWPRTEFGLSAGPAAPFLPGSDSWVTETVALTSTLSSLTRLRRTPGSRSGRTARSPGSGHLRTLNAKVALGDLGGRMSTTPYPQPKLELPLWT